VGAQNNKNTL